MAKALSSVADWDFAWVIIKDPGQKTCFSLSTEMQLVTRPRLETKIKGKEWRPKTELKKYVQKGLSKQSTAQGPPELGCRAKWPVNQDTEQELWVRVWGQGSGGHHWWGSMGLYAFEDRKCPFKGSRQKNKNKKKIKALGSKKAESQTPYLG